MDPSAAEFAASQPIRPLRDVLTMMGAAAHWRTTGEVLQEIPAASSNARTGDSGFPKLMTKESESHNQDVLQSTIDSAQQIQDLARRLQETETRLLAREQQLVVIAEKLESTAHAVLRRERQEQRRIDQQQSQVRHQQQQLMRLQQDILRSHEATRRIVEDLVVAETADRETVNHLRALQYELGHRFDHIARRWEQLASILKPNHAEDSNSRHPDARWMDPPSNDASQRDAA